ncbi:ABC transporter permease [Desulforamulus ruminis]|uniref:Transport permease protein n=1 Tax=Desulforamulus ruminis (strain ATCC 23193 / DSM 2154 / NCIMB 8452 / DL) TaxID=696281 RepID=F6DKT1_DESRL|nr:ABC transporter permease [Desulforamulus ruminis]AEG60456.1 ABC-2 type transporter [Desulforamulus ruminis DSM 2154]
MKKWVEKLLKKDQFSFKRFLAIAKKEFIQIIRDPFSLRIPISMPILWMLLFSYATTTDVEQLSTVVFDQSRTQESRQYIERFTASNYFLVNYYVASEQELIDLIDDGKAKAGLIIPPTYTDNIKRNRPVQTQLIIDGTEPTTARTALSSGASVSEVYAKEKKEASLKRLGVSTSGGMPDIQMNTKIWYNPGMESRVFIIPGLIGLILQNITTLLTAFALVRERERGTIEQLIVTPIKSAELILGKLLPYVAVGCIDLCFTIILAVFWFHVTIAGSLTLFLVIGLLFIVCSLALGILLSTVASNQMQALFLTLIVLLPSILLSGFIFPREAMPLPIYAITNFIPLTYFINITRGIFLKGVGLEHLWSDVLLLGMFTMVLLTIAIRKFKKSLD